MMYEVYALRDFQPFALACKPCTEHVLTVVQCAYASHEPAAPMDCELHYEGICAEERSARERCLAAPERTA